MDLRETGLGYMDWVELAQDKEKLRAIVNMIMNLPVP
jgi:hypothetical protein